MKVAVIGTGYVGLVSAACLADFGHEVAGFDRDADKIARIDVGQMPIYEPGLGTLVERNVAAGRLSFGTDLKSALAGAEVVFLAVGTPAREVDGHADLNFVFAAVDDLAECAAGPLVLVAKSTVPIGTNRTIQARLRARRPELAIEVASNPEFLREGSAIADFKAPDRVVIGAESETAREALRAVYRPLILNDTPVLFVDLETAEMIKYAANSFLATKVTFINEVADLCERVGANVDDVARGIGLDARIGSKFLRAGPGYGGSCFPKDTQALLRTSQEAGVPMRIVGAVVSVNADRKRSLVDRVSTAVGGSLRGKCIAVLGVTFKPDTDDMRDSPSLDLVPALQAAGADVRANDPQGMAAAATLLPGVAWCDDPYEAARGTDAVVLLTEWDVFRALDLDRLGGSMRRMTFIDFRNVYSGEEVSAAGFAYFGIGIGPRRASVPLREAAE